MKTVIRKEGNTVIISIQGHLDYETTNNLKTDLTTLSNSNANEQVVFDLADLQFVGSSGISAFVQTLRDFNTRSNHRPRYANVKNEFKRIISAFDETGSFEFWETAERAIKSFNN